MEDKKEFAENIRANIVDLNSLISQAKEMGLNVSVHQNMMGGDIVKVSISERVEY